MTTSVLSIRTQSSHWAGSQNPSQAPPQADWELVLDRLRPQLTEAGFDIAEPLAVGWYNDEAAEGSAIPLQGAAGSQALAILVGNTKNLWAPFLSACAKVEGLVDETDPLDHYTELSLDALAQPRSAVRVLYGHDPDAATTGEGYVGMQTLAEVAGLAYTHPYSHLSLHPRFGPWFALRAVLVFDNVEYTGSRKPKLQNPMDQSTSMYVKTAVRSARTSSSVEVADSGEANNEAEADAVCKRWRKWVAVRDAPCPGHNWRYPNCQLEYHYTHDKQVLRQALHRHTSRSRVSGDICRRSFSRRLSEASLPSLS